MITTILEVTLEVDRVRQAEVGLVLLPETGPLVQVVRNPTQMMTVTGKMGQMVGGRTMDGTNQHRC